VIFLNDGGQLVIVPTPSSGGSPTAALTTLLEWPQHDRGGLTTAINDRTRLLRPVDVTNAIATVLLSRDFVDVPARQELLAVAQVVYTATAVGGIAAVRFVVDGSSIEVPGGDGRLVTRPVGRSDYPDLLAAGP
jgi:spore germination protein GerM